MIRACREQAGLTQEELGKKVGVTRQTIAAWENRERHPSLEQLGRLAKALGVALDLLVEPMAEAAPTLLFRADMPSALSPELRALLSRKVEDYAAVEQLAGAEPVVPESRKAAGFDPFTIDTHAARIRDWLGAENAPLGDVLSLLENNGVKVILYPLPQTVSGFSAYTEELGGVIIVNSAHPTERQYFTALHELVHLIFHRTEYRTPSATPVKGKDPREKLADAVAGAILLPRTVIEEGLGFYRNRWIPEPVLLDIKKRYSVSMRTILIRAEQVELISRKQLGQQLGKLNNKYGPEGEGTFQLQKPDTLCRLERLVFLTLADEKITASRAAEVLGKPLVEVRSRLMEWLDEEVAA